MPVLRGMVLICKAVHRSLSLVMFLQGSLTLGHNTQKVIISIVKAISLKRCS